MKWTKKKPIEEGWYWMGRIYGKGKKRRKEVEVVYVRLYGGELCIMNWKIPDNVEWAGPIPEPVKSTKNNKEMPMKVYIVHNEKYLEGIIFRERVAKKLKSTLEKGWTHRRSSIFGKWYIKEILLSENIQIEILEIIEDNEKRKTK